MLQKIRANLPFFARYLMIGGFVFVIDFGTYVKLLQHVEYLWAQTISQTIAFIVHFTLNKYLNFRVHDRAAREQFGTYLVVALFCLVVGNCVVFSWVKIFGTSPTALKLAKCAAVGVNIPIGFIGHKRLTFGGGLRKLRSARPAA